MNHRVGFFLHSPAGGGMERVTLTLARGLRRRGHDVMIVTCMAHGAFADQLDTEWWTDLGVGRTIRALRPLRRWIDEWHPTHLISALPEPNLIALGAGVGRPGLTRIVTVHADPAAEADGMAARKDRVVTRHAPRLYLAADAVVAVSAGVRSSLIDLGAPPDRVVTISNPVIDDDFDRLSELAPNHPWLAEKIGPVVVAAARLDPAKDLSTLIRAFALLRAEEPTSRLVIFGDGEERPRLLELIDSLGLGECVDLPGFTNRLPAELRAADVFALSSRWEGFGNAIVEALGVGTTVVSTDCPPGPAEVLAGGEFGHLVPIGDPAEMKRALAKALAEPSDPALLRQRALDIGSVESSVDHYEALLDRVRRT